MIDGGIAAPRGEVTRRAGREVMDELEVAEAAADAAAREARRALHEKRKAELTAGVDERGKAEGRNCTSPDNAPPAGGRNPPTLRSRGFRRLWEHVPRAICRGWLEEILLWRDGPDDDLERRGEVDRLAIHSGIDRRGGRSARVARRSKSVPGSGRRVACRGRRRRAVRCRATAGCWVHAGVRASGVVRHEHDRGVAMRVAPVVHEPQFGCRRARSRGRPLPSPAASAPWSRGTSAVEPRRRRSRARRC